MIRDARTTGRTRARAGSPRSSASTRTHSTRSSTTSGATVPSSSPSRISGQAVPSAAPSNTCRLLARDHAAPEPTLLLTKALQPWLVGVRPLAWCSRPRNSAALLDGSPPMNQQISRLALASLVLVISLIVGTTYWQAWAAPGLADRRDNAIKVVAQFAIKRGAIFAADGSVLARNRPRRVNGKTFYFRTYPGRQRFAHAVGYSTQARSRSGIEQSRNDFLTGANANLATLLDTTLDRLRGATIEGNDLILTLRPA